MSARASLADALRAQARTLDALADALEEGADVVAAPTRREKRAAPRRRGPARVVPPADVTDLERAKARALARRAGIVVEG